MRPHTSTASEDCCKDTKDYLGCIKANSANEAKYEFSYENFKKIAEKELQNKVVKDSLKSGVKLL